MTITLTREEAQQVLDALEAALSDDQPYIVSCKQTVETLRARLAQPEEKLLTQEQAIDVAQKLFDSAMLCSIPPSGTTWQNAALRLGEELSTVGPDGYYNMTAQQWLDWAMENVTPARLSALEPEPVFEVKFEQVADGIEVGYDFFGGVDIRLGGEFVYVHINYDPRYTHNAARTQLADKIVELLTGNTAPPQRNDFNPDWDAMAVMVEEQQRMAKRIEELEAALAQPEPEPVAKMREMLEVQGRDGTWNYDPYFHGMYNGMEVMLAVLEDREPVFRGAPKKWLSKKEWQGLTDEEVKILATQGRTDFSRPAYNEFYSAIEAKLKEKNT